jgi:RNA polymerase sigma factor (sigma-70 family)
VSETANTDSEDRLETVLREIWPEVSAYACRRLPTDKGLAEDLVQEAAVDVITRWRNRVEMAPTAVIAMMKQSINCDIVDWWRKKDRHDAKLAAIADTVLFNHLDQHRNPEDETLALMARIDASRRADTLLALLDEQQRALIVAIHIDGTSPKQAAADLGITVRAVQMRLRKALDTLRRHAAVPADAPNQRPNGGPRHA